MRDWLFRTVGEHQAAMRANEYSSEDLTRAFLRRIEEKNQEIGAYLTVDAEGALCAARASDARRAKGELLSELDGIPYAAKDNFSTKGIRTTCASKLLEHFVPPYDATVIQILKDAGAVLLGKLNMDEFAMGSSNESSAFYPTRNPYDPSRVAGGSSGGSAAAVSAGMACFALGSDTGGSVRQPASFCGVVGLKPTYGVISRYGLISLASSMDAVGLLTHTAEDCRLLLSLLAKRDERDDTSISLSPLPIPKGNLRVGLLEGEGLASPAQREALERAKERLAALGATVLPFTLPSPHKALAAYSVLMSSEASSNLARFDGIRYGSRVDHSDGVLNLYTDTRGELLGKETVRRILFGSYVLQAEHRADFYERARVFRQEIRDRMLASFAEFDVILSPTTPTTAFSVGEIRTPTQMYHADLCTVYANLAGLPAISLPFGTEEGSGLPLSIQLTAAPHGESVLFSVASLLECPQSAAWEVRV